MHFKITQRRMLLLWNNCPERWGLFWRYTAPLGAFLCALLCCRGLGWGSSSGPFQPLQFWDSLRGSLYTMDLWKSFSCSSSSSSGQETCPQPPVEGSSLLLAVLQLYKGKNRGGCWSFCYLCQAQLKPFSSCNKEFAGIYEDFFSLLCRHKPAGFISWNFVFPPSSPSPTLVPAKCSQPWGCAMSSPELAPPGAVTPGCCCLPCRCLSTWVFFTSISHQFPKWGK